MATNKKEVKKSTKTSRKRKRKPTNKRVRKRTGPDPIQICHMTLFECKRSNTVVIEVLGDIPYYVYVSKAWWKKNSDNSRYKFVKNATT